MNARSPLFGPFIISLILLTVIAVFWPTFRDLLSIGPGNDELTHRILAIPVFFTLVWGLRNELSRLPVRIFWLGLFGMAVAGLVWLVGELSYIRLLTNIAVITMVPLTALTICGFRWVWALSFPLFYLLFAIQFRGPLVPLQVDWTARFTYMALVAGGVPVHREGPYFELPTGSWSIADTCSGIEYLSACIMLGVLFAWTMYASMRKRLLFIAGVIVVGICGNWLRAYLTILIAHVSDNRYLRSGHGTFGWVMFATLLFSYCLIGWYFRDQETNAGVAEGIDNDPMSIGPLATPSNSGRQIMAVSAVALAVLVAWPVIGYSFSRTRSSGEIRISRISPEGGWTSVERTPLDWTPTLINPSHELVQSFAKDGRRVELFIGIFANQSWSSKLVTSVNHFIPAESARWSLVNRDTIAAEYQGKPLQAKTGIILGDGRRIMAWQWYWIHGVTTGSDTQAKLEQFRTRLNGLDDVSAWISIYTLVDSTPEIATSTLNAFMKDMALPLERSLTETTRR